MTVAGMGGDATTLFMARGSGDVGRFERTALPGGRRWVQVHRGGQLLHRNWTTKLVWQQDGLSIERRTVPSQALVCVPVGFCELHSACRRLLQDSEHRLQRNKHGSLQSIHEGCQSIKVNRGRLGMPQTALQLVITNGMTTNGRSLL